MNRLVRTCAITLCLGLPLQGCNTTGTSTNGTDGVQTGTAALGVDRHGNEVAANDPTIPWSNQTSLKGDHSARLLEQGRESFRDANFGLSEKYFRQAVEIRADSVAGWLGLAASYDQLGRFDLADRAYAQLHKLKRNDARIVNNHGYSFLLRGDYAKAEKYFNQAQTIDPSLEEVQGNLHLLEKVRDT